MLPVGDCGNMTGSLGERCDEQKVGCCGCCGAHGGAVGPPGPNSKQVQRHEGDESSAALGVDRAGKRRLTRRWAILLCPLRRGSAGSPQEGARRHESDRGYQVKRSEAGIHEGEAGTEAIGHGDGKGWLRWPEDVNSAASVAEISQVIWQLSSAGADAGSFLRTSRSSRRVRPNALSTAGNTSRVKMRSVKT